MNPITQQIIRGLSLFFSNPSPLVGEGQGEGAQRRAPLPLLLALLLLPLWPAGDANADPQYAGALRGDYDVASQRACETAFGNQVGTGLTHHIGVRGTMNFNGSGTANFVGQSLIPSLGFQVGSGIPTGTGGELYRLAANLGNTTTPCSGPYDVNSDGTFSVTLNCNLTFTAGPNTGQSGTLNGIAIKGKLGMDGTILVLGNATATDSDVEHLDCPACSPAVQSTHRICTSTGTATARR